MGGRGANFGGTKHTKKEVVSANIAREIYGYNISDNVAYRYGKNIMTIADGTDLTELKEGRDYTYKNGKGEYTLIYLKNWLKDYQDKEDLLF